MTDREKQLDALLRMYVENEDAMCDALAKDLHKCRQESIINEVELLRNDVRNLQMNLRSYAAVEYVSDGDMQSNLSAIMLICEIICHFVILPFAGIAV